MEYIKLTSENLDKEHICCAISNNKDIQKDNAKKPHIDKQGFAVYYSHGCPFTAKYAPIVEQTAKDNDILFESVLIDSKEKAQTAPCAWTNYAVFHNGNYITNEILNEKKFFELVERLK